MRAWLILCLLLLGLPLSATAEDFVCGDASGLTRYIPAIDPSMAPASWQGKPCTKIPKAATAAQQALRQTVGERYLKVVNGLAVEMTQSEKDAVTATISAAQAVQQGYVDEVTTQDLCNATSLTDVNTKLTAVHDQLQTSIDAVTSVATAKTALTNMNDTYALALRKVLRCMMALRHVR